MTSETLAQGRAPMEEERSRPGLARYLWPSPETLRGRAPILVPLGMACALTFAGVLASAPLMSLAYAEQPDTLRLVRTGLWTLGLLAPVMLVLKAVLLGGIAWAVLVLMNLEATYKAVVSTLLYSEVVLGLQGVWMVCILWLRGSGGISGPEDLVVHTGLDAFVADPTSAWASLGRGVGPFHALWLWALVAGFCAIARTDWRRAVPPALAVWVVGMGMGLVRAWLV